MKKLMFIVAAALLAVGCNSTKTYVIEGQIEGLGGEVAVMDMSGQEVLATATAEEGSFSLSVESATPLFAAFAIDGEPVIPLFLDGSPITISGNVDEIEFLTASGTASNDAFGEFNKVQMEMMAPVMNGGEEISDEEVMKIFFEMQQKMDESYEANKENLWGAYLFVSSKFRECAPEEVLEVVAGYGKEIQEMEEIKLVKEYAEKALKTAVGQPYTNISMPNVDGQEVALKEVVEASKYVLLDFWASWCRPCMGEMPFLLEAYEAYHDKGFEIYGVSLDDNAEAWKQCIEKQGMKWVNVSNVSGWDTPAAKDYSVNSIPANFLIDATDGTIVAKDLRGEALGQKLAELFE